MLYIIGTPIGNLGDLSQRVIDTFKVLDVLYCEDTRNALKLLNHIGVRVSVKRADARMLEGKVGEILELAGQGKNVGFCSDSGMPCISDPGTILVAEAHRQEVEFEVIPGVSALDMALVGSGFPAQPSTFYGFLPRKKGRKTLFESWVNKDETIVFYESPIRIRKTLNDIYSYCGDRWVCVCREMTKMYEDFSRGKLSEIKDVIKEKGEFTVVLSPSGWKE